MNSQKLPQKKKGRIFNTNINQEEMFSYFCSLKQRSGNGGSRPFLRSPTIFFFWGGGSETYYGKETL